MFTSQPLVVESQDKKTKSLYSWLLNEYKSPTSENSIVQLLLYITKTVYPFYQHKISINSREAFKGYQVHFIGSLKAGNIKQN